MLHRALRQPGGYPEIARRTSFRGAPLCAALLSILTALWMTAGAARADTAEAATARYEIAVIASYPADACFDTGSVKAVVDFVNRRVARLNGLTDARDRRFKIKFYHDRDDPQQAIANVRKAINDPSTLAMVGLSGSNRSKAVFETLGKDIADRNIPFLTDLSVTSFFDPYPNVFTMRPSQENERLPVIGRFMKEEKFQRPAYIGMTNNAASSELAKGMTEFGDVPALVTSRELTVKYGVADSLETRAAVEDLKARDADFVVVMLSTAPIEQFLKDAAAAGLRAPMLFLTDNEKALTSDGATAYGGNLYQLAWQTLPNIHNNRLRRQMLQLGGEKWVFEDTPNKDAAGWKSGACKKSDKPALSQFDSANLRAIGRGTRYADMVGLIGEIVKFSPPGISLQDMRGRIIDGLKTTYAAGRGAYRGEFDNWSFHPLRRTASQTPVILMRSRGAANVGLAPAQYVKLRNDALRQIQTVYMDIDLNRIFRIDDNEKSFFAEFFMTVKSGDKFKISDLEFSNAFFDGENAGQEVKIVPLHNGDASNVYPEGIQIYKVTGKFMMQPNFSRYPFDTQLFSVELKPRSGESAFIVQPPPASIRDTAAETDGWSLQDQYVGFDEDYIPITDAKSDEKSIVPFYKVSFSWVMKREATDYYLRVVVPLAFILIVAYLSIFIPREHFEAVVTIQVTALLSAVALYLSIPKVGTDAATVSDRIFLFDYMAVSLMIAISISRVNSLMRRFPKVEQCLRFVHIVGVPLLVLAMAFYVTGKSVDQYTPAWSSAEVASKT